MSVLPMLHICHCFWQATHLGLLAGMAVTSSIHMGHVDIYPANGVSLVLCMMFMTHV